MKRGAVMERDASARHGRGGHEMFRRLVGRHMQVERRLRWRHVLVDRAAVGAFAEIKAAVFQGRVVERDPRRDDAFRIPRTEVIVVLFAVP